MKKYALICMIAICCILVTGCTSCVKNECKKVITPLSMNEYSLTIVDNEGVKYEAKDKYVFDQLSIGNSSVVSYIDGNPKLLVSVF